MKCHVCLRSAAILLVLLGGNLLGYAQAWETFIDLPLTGSLSSRVMADPWSPNPALPNLFVGGAYWGANSYGSILLANQTIPNTINSYAVSDSASGQDSVGVDTTSGDLYSTGSSVRRSADQGATWQPSDTFAYSTVGIANDRFGGIYAAGSLNDAAGYLHWVVRRSTDRGLNWATVLDLSSRRQHCRPSALCYAPGRGLFVVGRVADKWTVLRKRDTDTGFTTVDSWVPGKNGASFAAGIASDSQGNIFVCGATGTPWNPYAWVVRTSADGGASWKTILDRWYAGYGGIPEDISIDPISGNVWLAGYQKASASLPGDWTIAQLVRAANWAIVSEVSIGGDGLSIGHATGITVDPQGSVYAVGRFTDMTGTAHWIVQRRLQ